MPRPSGSGAARVSRPSRPAKTPSGFSASKMKTIRQAVRNERAVPKMVRPKESPSESSSRWRTSFSKRWGVEEPAASKAGKSLPMRVRPLKLAQIPKLDRRTRKA